MGVKFQPLDPPRVFATGRGDPIEIKDCGRLFLAENEQVTFVTESGAEYDVARKAWGFYATPSLNGRLVNFGLRAALVKSFVGKYYVFLVERGQESRLADYLALERNQLVRWLDNDADLRAAESADATLAAGPAAPSCMCGANRFTSVHMYFEPPAGEVRFERLHDGEYRREIFRCSLCGHFVSSHAMVTGEEFYRRAYVSGTYGDDEGVRRTFDRIVALPPEKSDNSGRVRRVIDFAKSQFGDASGRSVLDVGSGLCVFLHGMKQAGWRGTALDPDPRAAAHAQSVVGVEALAADFMSADLPARYDVVTFNKVLEHIFDPVPMLERAGQALAPGGFVYVEVPDGDAAVAEGFGREEFFIEHHHVFSPASAALLAARAGFSLAALERVREPSTKFTLRAFLTWPARGPEGTTA
jgi:SAM-dependent methyltransferase